MTQSTPTLVEATFLIVVAAVAAGASPARAEEPRTVHVDFELGPGAEACPDESGLRDAIATRIGYDPVRPAAELLVRIEIRRVGAALEAEVHRARSGGEDLGERRLTSGLSECTELIDALALDVSLTLDSLKVTRAAPPKAEPPSPESAADVISLPPPAAVRTPVAPTPVAVARVEAGAPRHETAVRIAAAAGFAVTAGVLPRPAPEVAASARLQWRRASLGVEGLASLPSSFAYEGGSIGTSLLAGALVGCLHEGWLSGCAVGAAGGLHATAQGYVQATDATPVYVATGLRAQLEIPVGRGFAARIHASLMAPLVRSKLLIGDTSAWTAPVLSFDGGLSLMHVFE